MAAIKNAVRRLTLLPVADGPGFVALLVGLAVQATVVGVDADHWSLWRVLFRAPGSTTARDWRGGST